MGAGTGEPIDVKCGHCEPTSVLEKLVDEAFSNEQKFQETKQKVKAVVDVDTSDAGHTYVFNDDKGVSASIHISDKHGNSGVKINGNMPSEASLIDTLALLRGTCDLGFDDAFIPTSDLGLYGITWKQIEKTFMTELEGKNRAEGKKRLRDVIYSKVMALDKLDYKSLKQVFKFEGILGEKYLGRRKDPLIEQLQTFLSDIAKVQEIAKENQTEYTEEGIKRLQQNILDAVGQRVGYQEYHDEEHRISLPNLVLKYDFADNGVKLEGAYLGKNEYLHSVKEIAKLTEAEKKLLSLAKSIEVSDRFGGEHGSHDLRFHLKVGEPTVVDYDLDSFGTLGVAERETARNLMDKLFPNFAYTKMESLPARYSDGMGGKYEVC